MYYDCPMYAPLSNQSIMVRNVPQPSTNLIYMLSNALKRSLNDYHHQKLNRTLQNQDKRPSQHNKKPSNNDIIVIDLESEVEDEKIVVCQKKEKIKFEKLAQKRPHVVENKFKESLLTLKQPQGHELTEAEIEKQQNLRIEVEKELVEIVPKQIKKFSPSEDLMPLQIQCPKVNLDNLKIQQKKENLLLRKVNNWQEMSSKGGKKKRQIGMLN